MTETKTVEVTGQQPIAWLYEKNGRQSLQFARQPWMTGPDRGWTETPLYDRLASQSLSTDEEVRRLREALTWIAKGDSQVFDDELECMVDISACAEEMQEVARLALTATEYRTDGSHLQARTDLAAALQSKDTPSHGG